ncbi:sensor histidine kinase [Streptomyces sp. TRM66268-LWL]|uniref:Sensor histidine kinase n=1 Tax=Streptomyces polyasparticus TaxID=2767826 RepID=A0ABR7SSG7_9ACTN|nr:ATP-binding protein [Streptomyces polyasparticus]MBC9718440.1 sensor histidine kinase [Streptomyces polyasparticus]
MNQTMHDAPLAPNIMWCELSLRADPVAVQAARIEGYTRVTLLGWSGNVRRAVDVLGILVSNALAHGITPGESEQIHVKLTRTEAQHLLLEVTDDNPSFPDFAQAVQGELGRGLWRARQLGAVVTWFLLQDASGKVVRAELRPDRVDL